VYKGTFRRKMKEKREESTEGMTEGREAERKRIMNDE
jgi:hypothetical protein